MAYEVTATRRRPQRFEDLVGQEFVTSTLINAIQSGKVAHAYLFSGPRGCGKTTSARILAKALNCEKGTSGTPCGECPSCKEISKGTCLDVIEIDGASNTSVNDVRQIKEEVLFPPNSCRYKIYIIDEVHMLSTSAFNALLKTIEEPPPYVIFIFATTELHKVPATIKSRCQQFNFKLGDIESIKQLLSDTCKETGITADDEALFWIARESTGSFRDAYTLFDQVAAFSDGEITFDKIQDKLGIVGLERINDIADACTTGDTSTVLSIADEILQTGVSLEQFISDLADYFRSLLLLKNGITKESLLGHDASRFSITARECWTAIQLERAVALLLDVFRDIRYSLSPRYELDVALSRLAWLKEYVSPAEIKRALDSARALLLNGQEAGRPFLDSSPDMTEAVNTATQRTVYSDFSTVHTKQSNDPNMVATQSENPFDALKLKWKRSDAVTDSQKQSTQQHTQAPAQAQYQAPAQTQYQAPAPAQHTAQAQYQAPAPAQHTAQTQYQAPAPAQHTAQAQGAFVDDGEVYVEIPASYTEQADVAPSQESQPQSQTTPPPVTPVEVDADALRDSLINYFADNDDLTAEKLSTVTDWKMNDRELVLRTPAAFLANDLEKQKSTIARIASEIAGTTIYIKIEIIPSQQESETAQEVPQEVELLCKMFRGTVVSVVKDT